MVGQIYAPNVSVPLQGLAFGAEGEEAQPVSAAKSGRCRVCGTKV